MACNYMTITCYYMHYMPLHAPQDAHGVHLVLACTVWYQTKTSGTALYHLVPACTYRGNLVLAGTGMYLYILVHTNLNFMEFPFLSSKSQLTHYNLKV